MADEYIRTTIEYEGLRELAQALKEVDTGLLDQLRVDSQIAGDVVRDEARRLFTGGVARNASIQRTAEGFETRVRLGGQARALIVVGQRMRSQPGPKSRPLYGSYQMRHALLPARTRKIGEVEEILDQSVGQLLHRHGF